MVLPYTDVKFISAFVNVAAKGALLMSSRVESFNVPPGFRPARPPITSLALTGPPPYSHCPICLSLVSKCKCLHLSPPPIPGSLMGRVRAWQPSHFKAEVRTKKIRRLLEKNSSSPNTDPLTPFISAYLGCTEDAQHRTWRKLTKEHT